MKYQNEVIFVVLAIAILVIIGNYVIQNKINLENSKNAQYTKEFQANNPTPEEKPDIQVAYSGVFSTAAGATNRRILKIDSTGTAVLEILKADYRIVQFGSWVLNPQKELVVTITGQEGESAYATPLIFVFSYNAENILIANTYNTSLYQEGELNFKKLTVDEVDKLKIEESTLSTTEPQKEDNLSKEKPAIKSDEVK